MPKIIDCSVAPENSPPLCRILELFTSFKAVMEGFYPMEPAEIEAITGHDWEALLVYLENRQRQNPSSLANDLNNPNSILYLSTASLALMKDAFQVFERQELIPYILLYLYYQQGDLKAFTALPDLQMSADDLNTYAFLLNTLKKGAGETKTQTAEMLILANIHDLNDPHQLVKYLEWANYPLQDKYQALLDFLQQNLPYSKLTSNIDTLLDFAQGLDPTEDLPLLSIIRAAIYSTYPFGSESSEITPAIRSKIDAVMGEAEA